MENSPRFPQEKPTAQSYSLAAQAETISTVTVSEISTRLCAMQGYGSVVEHLTRDWKVAGSILGKSGGNIFFSS